MEGIGIPGLKEAEKAIEDVVKHGEKEINNAVNKGEKEIKGVVNKGEKEIKGVVNQGEKEINSAVTQGEKAINKTVNQGEEAIKGVVDSGLQEIKQLEKTITSEIQSAVESSLVTALKKLFSNAGKIGLRKAIGIMETCPHPTSLTLELGPLEVSVSDPYSKLDTLKEIAQAEHLSPDDIARYVKELSPTDLSLKISTVEGFDVGCTIHWSAEDMAEDVAAIIKAASALHHLS